MPDWLWTVIGAAGIAGMAALLYFMDGDKKRGYPAVAALSPDFKSLDMRLKGYTPAEAFDCLEKAGPEGWRLLHRLWKLDSCFLVFFAMVMAAVTHNVVGVDGLRLAMYLAVGLRTLADAGENALLMAANRAYPAEKRQGTVRAACAATRIKWAIMGLWVVGLFGNLLFSALKL